MTMVTRRTALRYIGTAALLPATALAAFHDAKKRRSWWDFLFESVVTDPVSLKPTPQSWQNATLTMAWIGHSTVLINFFGTVILTDPVLTKRIGIELLGIVKAGPQRLVEPALTVGEIPKPDLILLSHAHMDHLDTETIRQFPKDIPIITAKNTADVLQNLNRKNVKELDWGEYSECCGLRIEALRVKHFGWRYPWEEDRSRGNWNGRSFNAYLLSKNGHTILFGGDTAYQEYFKEIGNRGISVTAAIMPIGAYDPWIHNHCTPEQAIQMAQHVNAKFFFPIHWGTFIQSNEPRYEPIERLQRALTTTTMYLGWSKHGETWSLNNALNSLTEEEKDCIFKAQINTAGWSNW